MNLIGIIHTDPMTSTEVSVCAVDEIGKFFNAWLAPCCPDIEKESFSISLIDSLANPFDLRVRQIWYPLSD